MPEHPVEIRLIIPGKPDFLRLARLAAADAGSRAGLTFELDDEGLVVRGVGPPIEPGGDSKPSELSRTIVAAVVDEHDLDREGDALHFRLLKRARRR